MIHLQGMGLLGSLTAWQLHRLGVEFTWEDNYSEVTAWQACTGGCYPSGGEVDSRNYDQWLEWADAEGLYPKGCLEVCQYWVDSVHRSLPHHLQTEVLAEYSGLRLAGRSVHLNAQLLVQTTRQNFVGQESAPNNPGLTIIAHGFGRAERYLWGWSRLVKLDYPKRIAQHGRPCFYLRKNRFQFAYCFPQPGTNWWYAGSSLVSQRIPKPLKTEPRYASWKRWFADLSQEAVQVVEEAPEINQGWRPALGGTLKYDTGVAGSKERVEQGLLVMRRKNVIQYPPMSSNGFRHFPEVWKQVEALL